MPDFSIITGIYNSSRHLPNYFRMLEQQTFGDWEAILVDDGSTDDSRGIIEAKVRQDSRYRLICKTPEGSPSRSRARGLSEARGRWVAFVDHDDLWAPQKLEAQKFLLETVPGIAILHTDRIVWRDQKWPEPMSIFRGPVSQMPWRIQEPEEVIYQGLRIIFSSFAAPRELVQGVGFHPDLRGVDDFYLFVRLASLGSICHVEFPLTYYAAHGSNLSHSNNIFVEGFWAVSRLLDQDDVPDKAKRSVRAQALRTEAVSLFASDRLRALRLLLESLRTYFIASTLTRLLFLLVTLPVPKNLQKALMSRVKKLKFDFPVLKDLFRRG
jgi:glycosyltransferase involved in cell wall biosynthesis